MKFVRCQIWMCLLFAVAAMAEEVSPPSRRKSTIRVYDQRPIHVPGAWESPALERRPEPEYLPSAGTGGFRTQGSSMDGRLMPMQPISTPLTPTVSSVREDREKQSSWLKPLDFLSESDLIGKKDLEEFSLTPSTEGSDSPLDWSTLQESLISTELQTPSDKKEETKSQTPLSPSSVSPGASPATGLTLAPVVREVPVSDNRSAPLPEARDAIPGNRTETGNSLSSAPLPSALRMDSVQTMNLPASASDRAFERSRAEFQAVQTNLQRPDATSPFSEGRSTRTSFAPSAPGLGISPLPNSGVNTAPAAIPMPSTFASPLQPVAIPPPAVSAPPPSPVTDRDRFRTEDYRIRPRSGSSFP